jgi:hypothetical protein
MPTEKFYEGLALPEAIRKLAEHHSAPMTRHFSQYEYQLLLTLADRVDRPPRQQRLTPSEINEVWQRLVQTYSTKVESSDGSSVIVIQSIPERAIDSLARRDLLSNFPEVEYARRVPSSRDVPAALVALEAVVGASLASLREHTTLEVAEGGETNSSELLEDFLRNPSRVQALLSPADYELMNRALYQRSVATELSPPSFKSIQKIISAAGGAYVGVGQHFGHLSPAALIEVPGMIVLIYVATGVGQRLSEAIEDLGRTKRKRSRKSRERR